VTREQLGVVPEEAEQGAHRARAMRAWGAASTLGGAIGVLAGGVLSGYLG
jgi:hypothetical protein